MVKIKRVYEAPAGSDGTRVLVDRLWPRGLSKERAAIDTWLKEVAPSPELRAWFGHRPERFAEFRRRYMAELAANPAVGMLETLAAKGGTVTLLYGAKDTADNNAVVLQECIAARLKKSEQAT